MSAKGSPQATLEETLALLEAEQRARRDLELRNQRLEEENDALRCDEVTGLPVRKVFARELTVHVEAMLGLPEARRYLDCTAFSDLLYPDRHGSNKLDLLHGNIDVWLLRYWNNTFGHDFGDQVLRALATAMVSCAPPEMQCYRAGERGDEFMILARGTQEMAGDGFGRIKLTFQQFSVPSEAIFIPNVDIGWATISDALWAYAAIIAECPVLRAGHRANVTLVMRLLQKIADIRSRVNKVRARALLLVDRRLEGGSHYKQAAPHLYGGTDLEPSDIDGLIKTKTMPGSVQEQADRLYLALMVIATRGFVAERQEAHRRYAALKGLDGSDSLIARVQIDAALNLPPFHRRP